MNSANNPRTTRGQGLLENYLSGIRAKMAGKAIKGVNPGRILDIGCGSFPLFLSRVPFREKYGLDRTAVNYPEKDITIKAQDLNAEQTLPFSDSFFDAVCGLAVFEHLDDVQSRRVFSEVHRILVPGGLFVLTIPHARADRLLRSFSRIGLISPEELDEHKQLYDREMVAKQLVGAGFRPERLEFKAFELGLNLLVRARKQ